MFAAVVAAKAAAPAVLTWLYVLAVLSVFSDPTVIAAAVTAAVTGALGALAWRQDRKSAARDARTAMLEAETAAHTVALDQTRHLIDQLQEALRTERAENSVLHRLQTAGRADLAELQAAVLRWETTARGLASQLHAAGIEPDWQIDE